MSNHQNEPREYDAVLGGQNLIPVNAAILGGISGVKSRLASPAVEVRIATLSEAPKYGEAGLDLIIQALHDESMQVKFAAYSLLKDRNEEKIQQHLRNYFPIFEFDVITVDAYGKENSRTKSFARFFAEDLGNSIVLEMVYIPGGTFMMGSLNNEEGRYDYESPQHQVTVPAFYAGKYPITQGQWQAVMGNKFNDEKRPIVSIWWDKAVEFCGQLSQKTGKKYRLLSEAEWEYACRARTTTPFHFGQTITPEFVNYQGNRPYANAPTGLYRQERTDVGNFPPNAFGLYDMHGNVCEWCSDRWHSNYNGAPTDGSSWETGTGNDRVLRGGSWYHNAVLCRSAMRNWDATGSLYTFLGFRVALEYPDPRLVK